MPENFNDYIEKKQNSQKIHFFKSAFTFAKSEYIIDLWRVSGNPTAGTFPGSNSATYYSKNSTGALQFKNPSAGKSLYLSDIIISSDQKTHSPRFIAIFDRFFTYTLTNNLAGTRIITPQSYPRNGGLANFVFLEANQQSNPSNNLTIALNYTNKNDQIKNSLLIFPQNTVSSSGFTTINSIYMLGLTDGDSEFKSINSITMSNSVSPNTVPWSLTTGRLIGIFSQDNKGFNSINPFTTCLKKIETDSCINFITMTPTTSGGTGQIFGCITLVEE